MNKGKIETGLGRKKDSDDLIGDDEYSPSINQSSQSEKKNKSLSIKSDGKIERQQVSFIDKVKNSINNWNFNIFNNSNRTKCKCDSNLQDNTSTCSRALKWLFTLYKDDELVKLKQDYEKLKENAKDFAEEKQKIQIEKDITRTFGNADYLDKDVLRRVLTVWSVFDPSVGYVQGMNFVVATLLYHAEEYVAFYLLEMLTGRFEIRDIYQNGLPGLVKHCKMIDKLMEAFLPDLYQWFLEQDIQTQFFCSQWIFSIFGVMIPLKYSGIFYDNLFQQKWVYFYKIVLQILEYYKDELLEMENVEILQFFSTKNLKFFDEDEIDQQNIKWEDLLNDAALIIIDIDQINNILDKFDSESKEFQLNEEVADNQITEFQG
ncbi:rab-GTPase-TBC domain protein (macronuclear) [Tetrahymena thermophila SB210]|uniref:Rab-GTPase-TBC domain protein n=1 Tax=Tetrahymena thermophila (strain SB210) TaxID=312017 RepID=I7MHD7_TETTS|nr:rab-GTPase-TBC domain protein [Tetrahymena thermophila SB210]EAS02887.3 rab-GTPase-TBC domain protein [Tetrahymena thermophila SB210]|eukprot:XP_001023132.3 rab-GTPase-TBC domain protein [Tetrahymena thermophila SB210]